MKTFGQFKTEIREILFPAGEAGNLQTAHNKQFIDSLIDLQTYVDCLQQDNTDIFPHCSTFYDCGLTVIPAPRGMIKKLSVVDSKSDGTIDWCTEIEYLQVKPVHIREYLHRSHRCGHCLPFSFFGLNNACIKGYYPIPTDVGVPVNLPVLPLGYHYPQTSTDRRHRSPGGVWAIERGKIFIAPYIQSTESVIVKWDGIKRTWNDGDPIDEDPLLSQASTEYVRWQHSDKYDKDESEAARAMGGYNNCRTLLMHQCREENRIRGREPSYARGTPASSVGMTLFYNEVQSYSTSCPDGTHPVTVTIAAGTVNSPISVADANSRAHDEAVSQANAQLNCGTPTGSFANQEQSADAVCQAGPGAPPPDGNPASAHVVIPAGTVTSDISVADANNSARAMAQAQATAQLRCKWWNAPQTATVHCPDSPGTTFSETIAPHTYSSTLSQDDANNQAAAAATAAAIVTRDASHLCAAPPAVMNQEIHLLVEYICASHGNCRITVHMTIPAGLFPGDSQASANAAASMAGAVMGNAVAISKCQQGFCGLCYAVYGQPVP